MSNKEEKPDIIEPLEGQISFFESNKKIDNIAQTMAIGFFDMPIKELEKIRNNPPPPTSSATIDAALQFYRYVVNSLRNFLSQDEAAEFQKWLYQKRFVEVVQIYGELGNRINNGEPAKEALRYLKQNFGSNLPRLNSIKPKDAILNISKVANELTVMGLGQNVALDVGKRGAKRDTTVMVSLAFTNSNVEIISRQPYTGYDRAVYNAICSLWQAGNNSFTPTMVYNAMNGTGNKSKGGASISPQALEAVTRSIEKQRFTRLKIDCSEQMRYYKGLKSAKFDANMLYIEGVEMVMQNGQKVNAYKFVNPDKPPVLYEYSRSIGQVATVSPALLDTSSSIRSTDEIIVIREYLIRRIEGMKGDNNLVSKKISFDAIYFELDIELSELTGNARKDIPKRIRKNTETLLSHFKKEGYIKDFAEYKDGRTIKGIVINL